MKIFVMFIGAFYGLLSILLGAFGAHGLKKVISTEKLESFEVGVRYQMYHALFLLLLGFWFEFKGGMEKAIAWLAIFGVILFSGSIYLLSMSEIWKVPNKILGPITPLGGLLLIISWLLLMISILRN